MLDQCSDAYDSERLHVTEDKLAADTIFILHPYIYLLGHRLLDRLHYEVVVLV